MRDFEKVLNRSAAQLREDLGPGLATEIACDLLTKLRSSGELPWSPSEQIARRVTARVRELAHGTLEAQALDEIYAAAEQAARDVLSPPNLRGGVK